MYIYNLARSVQTQDTIKVVRYKSAVEPQGGKKLGKGVWLTS